MKTVRTVDVFLDSFVGRCLSGNHALSVQMMYHPTTIRPRSRVNDTDDVPTSRCSGGKRGSSVQVTYQPAGILVVMAISWYMWRTILDQRCFLATNNGTYDTPVNRYMY